MTLPKWFFKDSETKTIMVIQDKQSLMEASSRFQSRISITIGWFALGPSDMKEQLHYFKPLHPEGVQTHLRS